METIISFTSIIANISAHISLAPQEQELFLSMLEVRTVRKKESKRQYLPLRFLHSQRFGESWLL
jgi:hypothetical protein